MINNKNWSDSQKAFLFLLIAKFSIFDIILYVFILIHTHTYIYIYYIYIYIYILYIYIYICIYMYICFFEIGNWLKNFFLWKFQEKSWTVADIGNWVFQEHTKRCLFSPLQTLKSCLGFVTIDSPIKYWLYYWKGEFM